LHQVGTSSLLIYMMHGHTYIKCAKIYWIMRNPVSFTLIVFVISCYVSICYYNRNTLF